MSRKLAWTDEAWVDYVYWQTHDRKTLKRIDELMNAKKNTTERDELNILTTLIEVY